MFTVVRRLALGSTRRMADVRVSLFSPSDWAAAFALLVPPDEAERLATRWFAEFAKETDELGRYVRGGGWSEQALPRDQAWKSTTTSS